MAPFDSRDGDDFCQRLPLFNGEKYHYWKERMQIFIQGNDFDAWEAIEDGPFVPTYTDNNGMTVEKPRAQWTGEDKKKVQHGLRAKYLISCALSHLEFYNVINCKTAQEMWNTLRDIHEGTGNVKMIRIGDVTGEYERFRMKPDENLRDMQLRFYNIVNRLASLGNEIPNKDLVNKVLRCLTSSKCHDKVIAISQWRNLSTVHLGSLFRELEEYEVELNRFDENDELH